jgi:hypothetical protein
MKLCDQIFIFFHFFSFFFIFLILKKVPYKASIFEENIKIVQWLRKNGNKIPVIGLCRLLKLN